MSDDTNTNSGTAPRVSIIIATCDAASTLERCLRSILDQDYREWELLVSDGASTDGTVDVITGHEAHIAWWQSSKDHGIYDAWNHALPHARGEYVCFLGADDIWIDAGALQRLFAAIGDRSYDLVTSRGLHLDGSGGRQVRFGSAWDYERIGRRMVVCHPGLLHRRSLFDRYGLFDTRYRIAGDLDFLLRLPSDVETLHVDTVSVGLDTSGISRTRVFQRLREQRIVLSRSERYGPFRAFLAWLDKLARWPLARILKLPH